MASGKGSTMRNFIVCTVLLPNIVSLINSATLLKPNCELLYFQEETRFSFPVSLFVQEEIGCDLKQEIHVIIQSKRSCLLDFSLRF